jgi:hypothetical protein
MLDPGGSLNGEDVLILFSESQGLGHERLRRFSSSQGRPTTMKVELSDVFFDRVSGAQESVPDPGIVGLSRHLAHRYDRRLDVFQRYQIFGFTHRRTHGIRGGEQVDW